MSILKHIDRLRGILGRDCNGKALRVGDLAEPVRVGENVPLHLREPYVVVLGRGKIVAEVMINVPCPSDGADWYETDCHLLRKIDNPDNASWDNVTESTGWSPKVVKVKESEHALDT